LVWRDIWQRMRRCKLMHRRSICRRCHRPIRRNCGGPGFGIAASSFPTDIDNLSVSHQRPNTSLFPPEEHPNCQGAYGFPLELSDLIAAYRSIFSVHIFRYSPFARFAFLLSRLSRCYALGGVHYARGYIITSSHEGYYWWSARWNYTRVHIFFFSHRSSESPFLGSWLRNTTSLALRPYLIHVLHRRVSYLKVSPCE
jgi:hypothetical protein